MERKYNKYGYFFISPFFLVFGIFAIYPILFTLYISLTRYKGYGQKVFIGLENYAALFKDPNVVQAFLNTVQIWGVNIVLQLFLAFMLVMMFSDIKYKFKGLGVFRILFYLPNLIAATTVSLIFVKLLDRDYGVVNQLLFSLDWISNPIGWLTEPVLAQLSVSGIQTWMWFGNSFILFMASVQAVDKSLYEAAAIDGAGRFNILRSITIPSIKPILMYVAITGLIGGLQLFEIPYLLTDGKGFPEGSLSTMIIYIYNMAFVYKNYGYAAAMSFALFFLILLVTAIFTYMTNRTLIKEVLAERKKVKETNKLLQKERGVQSNG